MNNPSPSQIQVVGQTHQPGVRLSIHQSTVMTVLASRIAMASTCGEVVADLVSAHAKEMDELRAIVVNTLRSRDCVI